MNALRSDFAENSIMQTISIAVSAILIAAGLITAPSLINNARDVNAKQDLANISLAQEYQLSNSGAYTADTSVLTTGDAIKLNTSAGASIGMIAGSDCYSSFAKSNSGTSFYRTSVSTTTTKVPVPWPTVKPVGYPANCDWPMASATATGTPVTNLLTNPSFETSAETVAVRTNLATNPNFETADWFNFANGASGSRQTVSKIDGAYGLKVSSPANGISDSGIGLHEQLASVTAGVTYTYSASIRALTADTYSSYVTANSSLGVQSIRSYVTLAAGQVGRISVTDTAKTTGPPTWWLIRGDGTKVTNFDVDNVMIEATTSANSGAYFDGGTAAGGDFTYGWQSGTNVSASEQRAINANGARSEGVTAIGYQSSVRSTSGTKSLAVLIPPTASAGNSSFSATAPNPTVIGKTYTVSANFYRPTGAGPIKIGISNIGGGGESVTTLDQWQRLSYTFVSNSVNNNLIQVLSGGGGTKIPVYVDAMVMIEVPDISRPYTGPLFDGDTLGDHWLGAQSMSQSVGYVG